MMAVRALLIVFAFIIQLATSGDASEVGFNPEIAGVQLGMTEHEALLALKSFDPLLKVHVVTSESYAPPREAFDSAIVAQIEGLEGIERRQEIVVRLSEFTNRAYEVIRYKEFNDAKAPQATGAIILAVAEKFGLKLTRPAGVGSEYSDIKAFGAIGGDDQRTCAALVEEDRILPSYMFADGTYVFQTGDVKDKDGVFFSPVSDSSFRPWKPPYRSVLAPPTVCGTILQVDVLPSSDQDLAHSLREHMFDPKAITDGSDEADKVYRSRTKAEHDERMKAGSQPPKL